MIMMAGIDGLKRLFDSNFFPIAFARNVGLSLTNVLTPVKVTTKRVQSMNESIKETYHPFMLLRSLFRS